MYMRRTADPYARRALPGLPIALGAAALATLLGYARPAYPVPSPACFKVCSKLFYKHISTLMKCAVKETVEPGTGVPCATTAATRMTKNYATKLQSKCGAETCQVSYPGTQRPGCIELTVGTGFFTALSLFGTSVGDNVTASAIALVEVPGCAY